MDRRNSHIVAACIFFGWPLACKKESPPASGTPSGPSEVVGAGAEGGAPTSPPTTEVGGAGGAPPPSPTWQPPLLEDIDLSDARAGEFSLHAFGLYSDPESNQIAPDLFEFEPRFPLWTDGAEKRRWLRLPEGSGIDASSPDAWQFPLGAVLFKQFVRKGRLVETRVIARLGHGPEDYFMGAFVWNDQETDAFLTVEGEENARGTDHDVPGQRACLTCHRGEAGRVLGFSAVQQEAPPESKFSGAVPPVFSPSGSATEIQAFGYLHGNCGHCHNERGSARPDTDMILRWSIGEEIEDSAIYNSTVGVPLQFFSDESRTLRIAPQAPMASGLLYRMQQRTDGEQMPPIGTELPDPNGLSVVEDWILSLQE